MSNQPGYELRRSKYRLLGLVGQGQFGRVFCAVHRKTGRLVALKELDRDRFPTHKFLRELRFLLSLQHENIVNCQALEHTRTGRYLVMDYCEGGTLRGLMEGDSKLSLIQNLKIVIDILVGLDHAHSRGIVHCDIKPENILLNLQPMGWLARISDFGIARLNQELVHEGGGNTGSPAYMAPERFYSQYSQSSDIYAVGILLFELLAGHRPFSGSPMELMSAHMNQPVKVPDTLPEALQPIILTALQKLPARRFRSAVEMLQVIQAVINDLERIAQQLPIHTLMQPKEVLPQCFFKSQHQEPLPAPITCLVEAVSPDTTDSLRGSSGYKIYKATGNQVEYQIQTIENLAHKGEQRKDQRRVTVLPEAVWQLVSAPQGCFAITQHSIHLLPLDQNSVSPGLVAESDQSFVVASDAQGRWLAIATTDPGVASKLVIWQFSLVEEAGTPPQQAALVTCQCRQPSHLLPLDSRHIAVVARSTDQDNNGGSKTLFEIFTRRGHGLGVLTLPVAVQQVVLTQTPYRLMATEEHNPTSMLLVDLKPFRVSRLGLEIAPKFLAATTWGYILADANGQITLLDRDGLRINRIDGPAHPTAMMPFANHGLLIATWDGKQGHLHTVDLRELEIDLMF